DGETDVNTIGNIKAALAGITPKVAVLDVQTDPPGATIYIQRKDLGARGLTPRKLGLEQGTYTVLVEKDGYDPPPPHQVSVVAGSTKTVQSKLAPIFGEVTIGGQEAQGAAVRLDKEDGPIACTAPCSISVVPGQHVLYFTRPGYQPLELPIDLDAKEKIE